MCSDLILYLLPNGMLLVCILHVLQYMHFINYKSWYVLHVSQKCGLRMSVIKLWIKLILTSLFPYHSRQAYSQASTNRNGSFHSCYFSGLVFVARCKTFAEETIGYITDSQFCIRRQHDKAHVQMNDRDRIRAQYSCMLSF